MLQALSKVLTGYETLNDYGQETWLAYISVCLIRPIVQGVSGHLPPNGAGQ